MNLHPIVFKFISSLVPFRKLAYQSDNLIIPLYHCVSDDNNLPHIKHLYPVKSKAKFLNDLEFLLKYYEPVSLSDVEDMTFTHKQFKRPKFLLTFDDGFKECYDIIAPILQQKGIPAIFFLNSAFVDNKELFYRCKVSLIIDEILKDKKKMRLLGKGNSLETIKVLKSLTYNDIQIIEELADKIEFSFDDYLNRKKPYMTTEQVKSLVKSGFYIGSHSIDHPNYNHIKFEQQLFQTIESTNFIKDTFKTPYRFFAFPFTDNGISSNFFDKIIKQHCDITFGTSGSRADKFNGSLQRIPFEWNGFTAKTILTKYLLAIVYRKINKSFNIERKKLDNE